MVSVGINTVRTYTVPPVWLLDKAHEQGLQVMVGLPWEQHVAFLDERGRERSIEQRVTEGIRACAGHPAVFCYAIGNEIPGGIVRWLGRERVERFLKRLYQAAKEEDPATLATYVNFPTTEYLDLSFLDFLCFNVYLEREESLDAYLARLQNLAGDRPLVLAEVGFDSRRNGRHQQAEVLDWQIRTTFRAGCAGAFVFAWTDEWHRGGSIVEDWDFGLTDRERRPKPALSAVATAFTEGSFVAEHSWPRVSVVVCTYNGECTLRSCLDGIEALDYPDYETIVVNDGSTDDSASIAAEYDVTLLNQENRGLSAARNVGMSAATGKIVAYIDDDAQPDPDWLRHLAFAFHTTDHAAVGGPNIPPPGDGDRGECIRNAPGGPVHVLLSDREAEHLPGCNLAVRKDCLEVIGGFDERFRVAGDDVDLCWRLQQEGWTLGFSAGAMVLHHRRKSILAYLRQQRGYGRAEASLERKWPEKYNGAGHLTWDGRLYGTGLTWSLLPRRWRVYYGTWGSAPFQSIYERSPRGMAHLPLMPESYLVALFLIILLATGAVWPKLLWGLLVLLAAAMTFQAGLSAYKATFVSYRRSWRRRTGMRALTAGLHLLQPAVRLLGRLGGGLTPWRTRSWPRLSLPLPRQDAVWREHWRSPEETLQELEAELRAEGASVVRGHEYGRWDLEVRGGLFGKVRLLLGIEEHGSGHQLVRYRLVPRSTKFALILLSLLVALIVTAGFWVSTAAIVARAALVAGILFLVAIDCAVATSALRQGIAVGADGTWLGRGRRPTRST